MIFRTQVIFLLSLVWGFTVFTLVSAQTLEFIPFENNINFAFSPNPVGSGARALGFGAFIAVADDATAASWNPGGLIQLKTAEISVVGNYSCQKADYTFSETTDSHSTSLTDLNYLSVAYPFTLWNRNMVISINYQALYDFTRKVSCQYEYTSDDTDFDVQRSYGQSGSLSAV